MKKLLVLILCIAGTYLLHRKCSRFNRSRVHTSRLYSNALDRPFACMFMPPMHLHDNGVDSYYSDDAYFDGSVKGGFEYGGGLELMPAPHLGIEVTYLRLDSKAPMEYYHDGIQNTDFKVAQNLIISQHQ